MNRLEVDLFREQEVVVVELRQGVEGVAQRVTHRVFDEAGLQMRMLHDEELVRPFQEVVDRRAHRRFGDAHEHLGVEVVPSSDEERCAAALVVRRDRDELEDPLDVRGVEAGLKQALARPVPDEALRAWARVDPGRLDADHPARPGLGGHRDPAERHHLLRREPGHGSAPADRHCARIQTSARSGLALVDAGRDVVGEHLDEERSLADDDVDRLLEELGEARHVHASGRQRGRPCSR